MENDENLNEIDDREEASIGMDEANDFGFERALLLMSVIEKCANVGVKATSIAGLAQASLNELNAEAKDIAKRRADEFAKAEAAVAARRVAKQRQIEAEVAAKARSEAEVADEQARSAALIDETPVQRSRPIVRPSTPTPDNRRL
jgi:hypothetical protein